MLVATGMFMLVAVVGALGNAWSFPVTGGPGLVWLLGVGFLGMGAYALVTGRVYGRTWEKYWGGWVNRSKNPGYFWSYTAMYLLGGLLLLLGCRTLS